MVAHQIQLLTEASILKHSSFPLSTWSTDEIIKRQSSKAKQRNRDFYKIMNQTNQRHERTESQHYKL